MIAAKKRAEDEMRKAVAASPKMQAAYGDAWDAIAKERKELPTYEKERRFLESQWGFNSGYFDTARDLVRMAEESTKPNAQRLPEYTDPIASHSNRIFILLRQSTMTLKS